MGDESSSPLSQEPAILRYPQPMQSNPLFYVVYSYQFIIVSC
jgi:hypothetical protein